MKKKSFSVWIVISILFISSLVAREIFFLADGNAHAYFFDVGQGDSALVVSPSGKQILIDGGPDMTTLERLGNVMPFFDRTIELLILSHPHLDHLAAFPEVFKRYNVERVLFTGEAHHMGLYEAMIHYLKLDNSAVIIANPKNDIDMGDGLFIDVLWPSENLFGKSENENPNDTSVVVKISHGEKSILFTGDIEAGGEAGLLALGSDLKSTMLKVPHHGSRTSSSTGFLLAVDPELAVISAGKENSFGHPHPDLLDRFASLKIPVKTTLDEGTISVDF